MDPFSIYKTLLMKYGPQGWWPLLSCKGFNPTKSGTMEGYHPNDYLYPKNLEQSFEISVGAILTQNTAWPNAEKALANLASAKCLSWSEILRLSVDELAMLIRPAGYNNQKSQYIRTLAVFFSELKGGVPLRTDLLSLRGIGEETADSILLYAFSQPSFVVDAYTRRIFSRLGLIDAENSYGNIKNFFEKAIPFDTIVYQEYHALIVEHGKHHYSKKPHGITDTLLLPHQVF